MSLQFIFGNSGSGKSDFLYDSVLKQAKENKEQQFLIIVPEQFTMQTQRELVERQKQHAIMNVDVLSFARLAYRVFDDLGKQNVVVLEETGKNLVLRKVAEQKKAELKVLGLRAAPADTQAELGCVAGRRACGHARKTPSAASSGGRGFPRRANAFISAP